MRAYACAIGADEEKRKRRALRCSFRALRLAIHGSWLAVHIALIIARHRGRNTALRRVASRRTAMTRRVSSEREAECTTACLEATRRWVSAPKLLGPRCARVRHTQNGARAFQFGCSSTSKSRWSTSRRSAHSRRALNIRHLEAAAATATTTAVAK